MRFILLALLCLPSVCFAQDPAPTPIPRRDVITWVRPEYPIEARRRNETGSGLLVLYVDNTSGHVTSVTVAKSTGHTILDDAAVRAFSQWRFKPGVVKDGKVKMPINFSISHGGFPRPPLNHSPNRGKVRVVHDDLTNR